MQDVTSEGDADDAGGALSTAAPARPLPSGWRMVKFEDVVRCVNDTVRDPTSASLERVVGIDNLDRDDLHVKRWGTIEDGTSFSRAFRKGQVLFPKRRVYQRKLAFAEFDGICSGDILVFEAKPNDLLPELLPFIVQTEGFFNHALGTSAGSLSPRTKWKDLAGYEFPLPPKSEQRRIAEILWAAEDVCEKRRLLLARLSATRQVGIDHLVPDPNTASGSLRYRRLDEVASMQNGHSFPSVDYGTNGVRLIRPGNLAADGSLDWTSSKTVCLPERYRHDYASWLIGPDQVLINLTAQSLEEGFIGRVCFTKPGDTGLLNQRIGRFIPTSDLLPRFLSRCLQTARFRRVIESRCEGSKIRHIYFRHMANFAVPVFSRRQQEEVVQALDAVDRTITATRMLSEHDSALRQAMSRQVLNDRRADVH